MDKPTKPIRELATRLIAAEKASGNGSGTHEVHRVCEKLRLVLTRFAGADAYSALMRRSLALSKVEIAALKNVKLSSNGCVEAGDLIAADGGTESGISITANFLWLLVTFMGEPIALRLVFDAWPNLPSD